MDNGGAKLALGAVTLDIPSGALAKKAFITIIPGEGTDAYDENNVPGEVILSGDSYTVGPTSLSSNKPLVVAFSVSSRSKGPGVYQLSGKSWNFIGSERTEETIFTEVSGNGTYVLGFDATPPRMKLHHTGDSKIVITAADYGSGIDSGSITVNQDGFELPFEYNPGESVIIINRESLTESSSEFEITLIDNSGNRKVETFTAALSVPDRITLDQNIPNPFNPITHITFENKSEKMIVLEVYDMLGRKVRVLAHDRFSAGRHTFVWDARDTNGRTVSSGTYIYRILSESQSISRKMLLLR